MKFYDMDTMYDLYRRMGKTLKSRMLKENHKEYYDSICLEFLSHCKTTKGSSHTAAVSSYNQAVCEAVWWAEGRPYYRFHPRLTKTFANTRLDFPVEYIKFPTRSLCVHFADNDDMMVIDDKFRVRNIIVYRDTILDVKRSIEAAKNKIGELTSEDFHGIKRYHEALSLYFDIGEVETREVEGHVFKIPVLTYRQIIWDGSKPELTLEKVLEMEAEQKRGLPADTELTTELMTKCLRIIVSLAFLKQDENQLIMPHILDKDKPYWEKSSPEQRQKMHKKAIDAREKEGWLVGCDEVFDLGHIGRISESREESESGRERQFAHLVSGHWKVVRYGHGRASGRIRWIMPYIVRDDLKFRPE